MRADVRSNTAPTGSSFDLTSGYITLAESQASGSSSTFELVDNAPASASCAAEVTSQNTGSVGVVGGCALIAGPIALPPP